MNYQKIINDFETNNFWNFMGFKLIEINHGTSVIELKSRTELDNTQQVLHGGAIMSLMDTSMGIAVRSLGAEKVSTIQLEIRFIESVISGSINAVSNVIHELKNTCIVECRVTNNLGNLIAFSTSTFKKLK